MNAKEMIMKRSTIAKAFTIAAVTAFAVGATPTANAWSLDILSGGGEDHLLVTAVRLQCGYGLRPLVPLLA